MFSRYEVEYTSETPEYDLVKVMPLKDRHMIASECKSLKKTYKKAAVVAQQGSYIDHVFFVESGCVSVLGKSFTKGEFVKCENILALPKISESRFGLRNRLEEIVSAASLTKVVRFDISDLFDFFVENPILACKFYHLLAIQLSANTRENMKTITGHLMRSTCKFASKSHNNVIAASKEEQKIDNEETCDEKVKKLFYENFDLSSDPLIFHTSALYTKKGLKKVYGRLGVFVECLCFLGSLQNWSVRYDRISKMQGEKTELVVLYMGAQNKSRKKVFYAPDANIVSTLVDKINFSKQLQQRLIQNNTLLTSSVNHESSPLVSPSSSLNSPAKSGNKEESGTKDEEHASQEKKWAAFEEVRKKAFRYERKNAISEKDKERLFLDSFMHKYKKGEFVIDPKQLCTREIVMIASGSMDVYFFLGKERKLVSNLVEGDFCNEYSVLLGESPSVEVVAAEDVIAYKIPAYKIREISLTHPQTAAHFFEHICYLLVQRWCGMEEMLEKFAQDGELNEFIQDK